METTGTDGIIKSPHWVIFDLDGTLADITERRKLAGKDNGKIHWGKFFDPANISLDKPNKPVIAAFNAMKQAGFHMAIFSGRSDATKDETIKWLKRHQVIPETLKMRPQKFLHMPDDELKKMWLDELFPGDKRKLVLCVFDDRDKVVRMWRGLGIPCFQVAEGDF